MAGGWDYYEEADQINGSLTGDDEEDGDSMPELESIRSEDGDAQSFLTPRNPHAATVEEDEDEDGPQPSSATAVSSRAVLRHVDSDVEDSDNDDHTHPSTQTQTRPAIPVPGPHSSFPPQPQPQSPAAEDFTDPQRVQRWLLTTGLADLQSRPETQSVYVSRLQVLRKQQQDWVVSMVRQRAGAEVEARLRGALA
jgi:hypothetical protein